ncbi:MAG TPA: DUF1292 domain-containing protein [Clostridiaceae bacterium]|jgi:uncharacterized protein YrzB (UPF0473 family)|nr:DUF1292 domain-containing protein [Clostridiaceae bacterium]HCL51258.1 DUF1292 domain-containing protein [Clostridiaceae bacterium]
MEEKENTVILTDEDGVDSEFEIVTILNVDNHEYCVLYPTDSDDEDAVVLKLIQDDKGDDMLTEIEDDDEFEKVAEAYDEWAEENEEYGEYPDEDEDTDDDEE